MLKLEIFKHEMLIDYAKRFGTKVFVETGTYKGDTVKAMLYSYLFDQIYTIDIFEDRTAKAMRRFRKFDNVTCLNGDSAFVLPELLRTIHEPALLWLDAHHSGKQIARSEGLIETPIISELKAALAHPDAGEHVIIIDDARYYETFSVKYPTTYPCTSELESMVKAKFPDHVFEMHDDIIRVHR